MTDCSNVDVRERLPDLLNDALGPGLRAAVLAHVAQCAECAAELEVLRQARRVMQRAPVVDVARIVAALPAPAPPRAVAPLAVSRGGQARATLPATTGRPASRWRHYAAAAGLLLAAGLAGLTWQRAAAPAGGDGRVAAAGAPAIAAAVEPARLLAVNVVGLSEDELAGLLDDLDDLEALPLSEPLPAVPVTPPEEQGGSE